MSVFISTKKKMDAMSIAKISMLGALSCLFMLFQFPLPLIAPPFYQIDFSEVVVLIGGFALGPWAAVCIEGIKILLNFVMNGSTTMGVGELANFIMGCALALPAAIIYKKGKNKKSACIGMLCGTIAMTIAGALLNYFVLIPAYAFFMAPAITVEGIVAMGTAIHANINTLWEVILICVVPFNLLKGILVSLIVFISYKKISVLIKNNSKKA